MNNEGALFNGLLRLSDDHLVLGHRLSEWCGHAPMLEEDLSLPNMALDLIGQARTLYAYTGEVEGKGRDEDAIAYLRRESEYKNLLLVERPNGDFAHTIVRQFYFAVFMELFWQKAIDSKDATIAAIAGKAVKEMAYHVRHCGEWIIRLGDGTEESARRIADAIDALHPYTDEMFDVDDTTQSLIDAEILPDSSNLKDEWDSLIGRVFAAGKISIPEQYWPKRGGRRGEHGEEMGFLLTDLQYMQRTYPDMTW
ncbi:MAG: 1,2-phenylacetyl-CoA epoxidase subunit PaaC [Pseudomonadota bacterium]